MPNVVDPMKSDFAAANMSPQRSAGMFLKDNSMLGTTTGTLRNEGEHL